MNSVRELVYRYLEAALDAAKPPIQEEVVLSEADELQPVDRGLFQEIAQGTMREWKFLDAVIMSCAKRRPRKALDLVLRLSAYQLLFLDRVPPHAIFAEAKKISEKMGCSLSERKFLHGVLKAIEPQKGELMRQRRNSLENVAKGEFSSALFDFAVLNAEPALLDALTVLDPQDLEGEKRVSNRAMKREARIRAACALVAMKARPAVVAYSLPRAIVRSQVQSCPSPLAPRALEVLEAGEKFASDLEEGRLRVQSQSSQWACEVAAKKILEFLRNGTVRVLEMASGKGGKFLGTLSALSAQAGSLFEGEGLEWVATDGSADQLHMLEMDALPLVRRHWPRLKFEVNRINWSLDGWGKAEASKGGIELKRGSFDLVWLDAPCTGFGTLGKLPQIAVKKGKQAYQEAKALSAAQRLLCQEGVQFLSNGGMNKSAFFYTVCTMTHPETWEIAGLLMDLRDREPEVARSFWPGSEPFPKSEGFFGVLI